jgi:hypothetical protein
MTPRPPCSRPHARCQRQLEAPHPRTRCHWKDRRSSASAPCAISVGDRPTKRPSGNDVRRGLFLIAGRVFDRKLTPASYHHRRLTSSGFRAGDARRRERGLARCQGSDSVDSSPRSQSPDSGLGPFGGDPTGRAGGSARTRQASIRSASCRPTRMVRRYGAEGGAGSRVCCEVRQNIG